MAALLLMFISQSCNEDIEPARQEMKIAFSVSNDGGPLNELPAGSRLVISVTSQSGEPVMELQEVKFYSHENGFVTESLTLPPGNYRISDFMVIDEDDEMLYAIPKKTSVLDDNVTHPLDFNFRISPDDHPLATELQLLGVRSFSPGDFGYRSFKILRRLLLIFVTTEGSNRPTTAKGFILNGNDTIQQYNLRARMNLVTVPVGVTASSKLVISKPAYAPVSFILLDLLRKQYRPVRAILKPAFTMLAYIDLAASSTFEFDLATTENASLYIDWGDGSAGSTYDVSSERFYPRHEYATGGNYPITITGDIDKITFFYSFYGQGMIDEINFQHLTALETIRFGLTRSPRILDLRQNSQLNFALLAGLNNLEYLYLPADHSINWIMLHGGNQMSTAAVDAVIDNIYQNSIRNNIMNGWFGLAASWAQPEEDESLVGPPSPAAIEKLRYLHENYGWTFEPNPLD
jgi:hypothetical protein